MPEIFRQSSFVVRIWLPPREHGAAHVHVWCPEGSVVIRLVPSIEIREIYGPVKASTIKRMVDAVADRADECLAAWARYHG